MTNAVEKEQDQTNQKHGQWLTVSSSEVGVFEQTLRGSKDISQEAIWERNVLEMECKGHKFGNVLDDFQDQVELMW